MNTVYDLEMKTGNLSEVGCPLSEQGRQALPQLLQLSKWPELSLSFSSQPPQCSSLLPIPTFGK